MYVSDEHDSIGHILWGHRDELTPRKVKLIRIIAL